MATVVYHKITQSDSQLDAALAAASRNASTTQAGLCPAGDGSTNKFLAADLTYREIVGSGTVEFGTTEGTACEGNDARLADARTPTAHKTSHEDGAADELNVFNLAGWTTGTTRFVREDGTFQEVTGSGGTTVVNSDAALGITIGPTDSGAAYECDGTADNVQFQAAVNAVGSGGVIYVLPGTYNLAEKISRTGASFSIIGVGNPGAVQINFSTAAASANGFDFRGSAIVVDTRTLTASASKGDYVVTVSSAASLLAGDLINISKKTLSGILSTALPSKPGKCIGLIVFRGRILL